MELTADFYRTRRWEKKRSAILRRDGYQCQECKRYGRQRQATTVHHKVPLTRQPDLALDNENLVSLCESCHNKMHPEKGRRKYRAANECPPLFAFAK